MATQLESRVKPAAGRRYDSLIEQELARAGGRVRSLDLAASAMVLVIGTFVFILAALVLDLCLDLPASARLAGLVVFLLAVLIYVSYLGRLFLRQRVNPYYAALQLERTLPDAKGSVINWLDLHERPLPPAIQASLGARAARDLGRADVEQAISNQRNLWLAAVTAGLTIALIVLFLTGPGRFGSLLARAFAPFEGRGIPTRTDIVLVQPKGGDATVAINQKVTIQVQVLGRVPAVNQPDVPRLHFRYNPNDPFAELPLVQDPSTDEWTATLLPDQVQNGFWYKITAGDAETPVYQIAVRSIPQVVRCDVVYHHRPYLVLPDRKNRFPNEKTVFPYLRDYRGTEVTLAIKGNRALKQGNLELDLQGEKQEIACEVKAATPDTLHCRFVMERSGNFRIHFLSHDGEANKDRSPYPIDVIPDTAPLVEIRKPGKDIELPANGTLRLEGSAVDDLGVKQITLRLRLTGPAQPALKPKVYREGKSFKLSNGRYPDLIVYKDFLALDGLKTAGNAAFPLVKGMVLEYWLEAVDNCDYPNPEGNLGQSKRYLVTIGAPEKDQEKVKQERRQAQKDQQEHEQEQDQQLGQLNQQIKDEQQKKDNPEQRARNEQQKKDFEKKLDDLKNTLDEGQKNQDQDGQAKGEEGPDKGAAKQQGPGQPEANKDAGKQPGQEGASTAKDREGKPDGTERNQAKGAGKDGDPKENQDRAHGKGKGPGDQQPQPQAKGGEQGKDGPQAASKAGAQAGNDHKTGAPKDAGQGRENASQAKGKDQAGTAADDRQPKGAPKPGGQDGPGAQPRASLRRAEQPAEETPELARSKIKDGPQKDPGQAKGPAGAQQRADTAQTKAGGRQQSGEQPSGKALAKGQEPAQPQGICKNCQGGGGQQGSGATAKDGGATGKQGQARAETKDGPQGPAPGNARAAPQRGKAPGLEDIARLKEELRRDQQARDDALEELSRLKKEAKDVDVRDAAGQALEQARQQEPAHAKKGQGQEREGQAKDQGSPNQAGGPPQTGQARDDPGQKGKESGTAKGGEPGKADAQQKGQVKGRWPEGTLGGQRTAGQEDRPPPGYKIDPAFARRAGDLHLEELKKKLTPDVMKKLNWTEKDRERFLKEARAYQEWLRAQNKKAGSDKLAGSGHSQLPGTGPRQVGEGPRPLIDPLDSLHVQPPPEFRDTYQRFTASPAPK
jgi:hypothetical protein